VAERETCGEGRGGEMGVQGPRGCFIKIGIQTKRGSQDTGYVCVRLCAASIQEATKKRDGRHFSVVTFSTKSLKKKRTKRFGSYSLGLSVFGFGVVPQSPRRSRTR